MRRFLIAAIAALAILGCALATVFLFSEFHARSQRPTGEAFADFVFILDTAVRQGFGAPFPPFDAEAYEAAMAHARPGAHRFVAAAIEQRVITWGKPALPLLARELERAEAAVAARNLTRIYTALTAIGALGGAEAAEILVAWLAPEDRLEWLAAPASGGGLLARVVSVLGKVRDPGATGLLIKIEQHGYATGTGTGVLNAIGRSRTPNAVDFLLMRLAEAQDEAQGDAAIEALIWPLAFTHDARAAEAFVALRRHPSERLRHSAMSAANQERGPHLLLPYLALLDAPVGDGMHAEALRMIAHPSNRGDARALAAVARQTEHPYLAKQARHTLLALLDDASIPRHREWLANLDAREMAVALRQLGAAALPYAQAFIHSPATPAERAGVVRQIAIQKVLAGRELLTALHDDAEPEIRGAARWALFRLDKMALLHSFLGYLPAEIGATVWRVIRGGADDDAILPDRSYGRGFDPVWQVFVTVHGAATVLAAVLGLLLVVNGIRVFDPYRFNLFLQFLLAEGLIGDFFLMDIGPRPDLAYLAATAAHLLLLIGMLCKEGERVPGALRNRFERLGGASLWLLVPLLLAFGTPVLAQVLRAAFADVHFFAASFLLTLTFGLMSLEQALLPLPLFFRSARAERILILLSSGALCALLAVALLHFAGPTAAAEPAPARLFAYLLLAPFGWMLLLHASALGMLARTAPAPMPGPIPGPAPTRRMRVMPDAAGLTVWFAPRRRPAAMLIALLGKLAFILAVAGIAGFHAGRAGGLAAILVALIAALFGAVLAALLLQAVEGRVLVQIRQGHARGARTVLGGVFRRAPWSRQLALPASVRRWLTRHREDGSTAGPLEDAERQWLENAIAAGSSEPTLAGRERAARRLSA